MVDTVSQDQSPTSGVTTPSGASPPALEVRGVTVSYHEKPVLRNVRFTIAPGQEEITVNFQYNFITEEYEGVRSGDEEGVIAAVGGMTGGFTMFIKDHRLYYDYNYLDGVHYVLKSSPLSRGETDLKFNFIKTKEFGGIGELYVDGEKVDEVDMPLMHISTYSLAETFDIGRDTGTQVSRPTQVPWEFSTRQERTLSSWSMVQLQLPPTGWHQRPSRSPSGSSTQTKPSSQSSASPQSTPQAFTSTPASTKTRHAPLGQLASLRQGSQGLLKLGTHTEMGSPDFSRALHR